MIYYGHRVVAMNPSPAFGPDVGNVISPGGLEAFLEDRRNWTAVTLADLMSRGQDLVGAQSPFYALTFDDGYLDNLTTLLPILEHRHVPAAIFITTGFVEGRIEPFEYALARLIRDRAVLNQPNGQTLELVDPAHKSDQYNLLRRKLKKFGRDKRTRMVAELQALNNDPPIDMRARYMLNWEEIREMAKHPLITIGAHSHTHPVLSHLSPQKTLDELRTSRSMLEANLNQKIDNLAYPYGSNNFVVRSIAGYLGFEQGFSTEERAVTSQDLKRPLALPRISLNNA